MTTRFDGVSCPSRVDGCLVSVACWWMSTKWSIRSHILHSRRMVSSTSVISNWCTQMDRLKCKDDTKTIWRIWSWTTDRNQRVSVSGDPTGSPISSQRASLVWIVDQMTTEDDDVLAVPVHVPDEQNDLLNGRTEDAREKSIVRVERFLVVGARRKWSDVFFFMNHIYRKWIPSYVTDRGVRDHYKVKYDSVVVWSVIIWSWEKSLMSRVLLSRMKKTDSVSVFCLDEVDER